MSDSLEKFIQRNREEFDGEGPGNDVWEKVAGNISNREKKLFTLRDVYKWSAAAAIFFIGLTSIYFLFLQKPGKETSVAKAKPDEKNLPDNVFEISKFAPEYANEAQAIFQTIETRQLELQRQAKDKPELYKEFTTDLKALDSGYHELKTQVLISSNRDIIIKAMIDNLKLQVSLLNRQLMVMQSFNNQTLQNEKKPDRDL